MKTKKIKIKNIYSLLKTTALVITLLTAYGCSSEQAEQGEQTEKPPVRVEQTELETMDHLIRFTGTVQPWEEAHVGSGAAMKIDQIFVDVDDYVQKGQLLAKMDETQLYQAKVRVNTLQNELERLDTLRQVGAATEQNYEQVKSEYEIAKSNLENLSENTEIQSPLTGVITGRYFSEGEIFSMSPAGEIGKPAIVSVLQIQPIKVMVNVSERYFPVIERGMQASITADMYPDKIFTGQVYKAHPMIDRASGTFKTEIRVDNEDKALRPGMYTRVNLNFGEKETLIVPSQTVLRQSGSNERYVFVEKDGIAIRKTVEIGERFDDDLEIISGLSPDENLIVSGQHNLIHQQEVRVVE